MPGAARSACGSRSPPAGPRRARAAAPAHVLGARRPSRRSSRSRARWPRSRCRPARCRTRNRAGLRWPARMMPQAALLWMMRDDRQLVAPRGVQLLQREAEGAVAGDVEHRPARVRQLQRQRIGQAEAEVHMPGSWKRVRDVVHRRAVVAPEAGVAAVEDRRARRAAARGRWPAPARPGASPASRRRAPSAASARLVRGARRARSRGSQPASTLQRRRPLQRGEQVVAAPRGVGLHRHLVQRRARPAPTGSMLMLMSRWCAARERAVLVPQPGREAAAERER